MRSAGNRLIGSIVSNFDVQRSPNRQLPKKVLRLCIFGGLPFVLFGKVAGFTARFEIRNKED
jgi:hypothetical protein